VGAQVDPGQQDDGGAALDGNTPSVEAAVRARLPANLSFRDTFDALAIPEVRIGAVEQIGPRREPVGTIDSDDLPPPPAVGNKPVLTEPCDRRAAADDERGLPLPITREPHPRPARRSAGGWLSAPPSLRCR